MINGPEFLYKVSDPGTKKREDVNKKTGLKEIKCGDRTILEAVV